MKFDEQRRLALAILSSDCNLTRKAGSFLGQCAVDQSTLSPAQAEWFGQLAERAGFASELTR